MHIVKSEFLNKIWIWSVVNSNFYNWQAFIKYLLWLTRKIICLFINNKLGFNSSIDNQIWNKKKQQKIQARIKYECSYIHEKKGEIQV